MKNLIRICVILILLLILSTTLKAQSQFAKIDKNRNVQAAGLYHDLNETRDTLILKSDKKINYLYSINKDYSREFDFYIDTTTYKLPLNKFSKGKHVFVAVQSPLRIVFVVHVLKTLSEEHPIEEPTEHPVVASPTEVTLRDQDE